MNNINIKAGVIIFISLIFATFSFYGYQILFTANIQVDKDDISLYVPKGATYETVLDSLKKHDILHDKLSFIFLSKILKYPESVHAGRYLIPRNSNNFTILKMLVKGRQTPIKLTFNNIRLKEDLANKVGGKFEFKNTGLLEALNNDSLCRTYGFDTTTIMAMFIPNTYEVYWTLDRQAFLAKMNQEYDKFWTEIRREKAQAVGLTPLQVSVLASIVESETNKNDEKPTVAGVYINRLKKGMRLEADPTVKFALKNFEIKRVLHGHIQKSATSPYNTYKHTGLPPGPICLPSIATIDAVLNYQKHNYLFFCARGDKPGYHAFASSYDEHLKISKKYHDTLDQWGIDRQ